ncbi:hypothetical protein JI735_15495 [Paenibacillus sonchi]|uniref:Uncharacterized protein n=1 Tax=Paenibacillus sonchi TaxID=373687 RepID=A0A974PH71_9BACL|nr:hypothetical protein [Paenibacillus sonchi]QQZ63710.1 hypothetical protein JI735_15495 [Paenibacillus sonchi]
MKKTILKVTLAATMMFSVNLGNVRAAGASTTKAPAAPVMTDNLSKYGLKKSIELPVTMSDQDFSYTLHKIMIYDFNSKEAKALRDKYGYQKSGTVLVNPKYLIWTKITIANTSNKNLYGGGGELERRINLFFDDSRSIVDTIGPMKHMGKTNNKDAMWTFDLNPGEKLTTYFAYVYEGEFDYFSIQHFGKELTEKYVVKE